MNVWEKTQKYIQLFQIFDKTLLPDKEAFYRNLNMENITDVDYRHPQRVFKNLNNKNIGDYHNLYDKSDT